MPMSVDQEMEQFYEWEIRGRGWLLWPHVVELEPPFRPFIGRGVAKSAVSEESFAGSIVPVTSEAGEPEEPPPPVLRGVPDVTVFRIECSPGVDLPAEVLGVLVRAGSHLCHPVAIELHTASEERSVHMAVRDPDVDAAMRIIRTVFPRVQLEEDIDPLWLWDDAPGRQIAVGEWGLEAEFMLPLVVSHGPHVPFPVVGACMPALEAEERACLQVLFQPAVAPWAGSMERAMSDPQGAPCYLKAPDSVHLVARKLGRPLIATALRSGIRATSDQRAIEYMTALTDVFQLLGHPNGNRLVPVPPTDLLWPDLQQRTTHRSGMLLTIDEVVALVRSRIPGSG